MHDRYNHGVSCQYFKLISFSNYSPVGVYGNPQFSIFSWALNYGFAYNLPTNSTYFTNVPEDVFNFPFKDLDPPTTTTVAPEILPIDHHEEVSWSSSGPPPEPAERKYFVYNQPKYETKPMLQRRYRRDIYRNIEGVIDKCVHITPNP